MSSSSPTSPEESPLIDLTSMGDEPPSPKALKTPIKTPTASSSKKRKLTPDEKLFRERERAEKRQKLEEERQLKEEDKKKKEIERLEKLRAKEVEKQEKERQKEAERLERERQKENERLKKEEERKKREEVKEQERLKKEEDLAKKAEEKKKKDDERLKKEEEKRKQLEGKERERQKQKEKEEKQASIFSKFFQKSPATIKKVKTLNVGETSKQRYPSGSGADTESDKENSNDVTSPAKNRIETEVIEPIDDNADIQIVLIRKPECAKFSPMPFQIKSNMAVAPLVRRAPLSETERDYLQMLMQTPQMSLENREIEGDGTQPPQLNKWRLNFIERVKRKEIRQTGRTKILDDLEEVEGKEKDVMIVMEDVIRPSEGYARYRMKLLQFNENRRPAYWGTWKKKSLNIKPTNPWTKEKEVDYEFDSDDEWEDEPEDGEEIENSAGEEEPEDTPGEGEPVDEDDEEGWMVPHGYLSDNECCEGEQMDIELVKSKERDFYRSLKEKVKLGIPVIQAEKLSDFKMLLPPKRKLASIRRSDRDKKAPSADMLSQVKGFLAVQFPSDDEMDTDWDDSPSEDDETDSELEDFEDEEMELEKMEETSEM